MRRRFGFTLMEVLVVISIIGILISIGTLTWSVVGARSRDSVRKTDLERLKNALQQYYTDQRQYPNFVTERVGTDLLMAAEWQLTSGCPISSSLRLAPAYISAVPIDPRSSGADCGRKVADQGNRYLYVSGPLSEAAPALYATSFGLLATLERDKSGGDIRSTNPNPLLPATPESLYFGRYFVSQAKGANQNYMLFGTAVR